MRANLNRQKSDDAKRQKVNENKNAVNKQTKGGEADASYLNRDLFTEEKPPTSSAALYFIAQICKTLNYLKSTRGLPCVGVQNIEY